MVLRSSLINLSTVCYAAICWLVEGGGLVGWWAELRGGCCLMCVCVGWWGGGGGGGFVRLCAQPLLCIW